MSPIDRSVVERKLDSIRTNLADIETIVKKGQDSYLKNGFDRKVVERSLQLVIEAAVDTNLHLLKKQFQKIPEDSAKSFDLMAQHGVLPDDLTSALAPSVGLRNRIVHQYDLLDAKKIFAGAEKALDLFPRYVSAILGMI